MPVAGVAILAAMLTLTVLGARRRAWWWTLPACAMLALLPTTSVVPLADAAVDHRMYLPLVAVAGFLALSGASPFEAGSRSHALHAMLGERLGPAGWTWRQAINGEALLLGLAYR